MTIKTVQLYKENFEEVALAPCCVCDEAIDNGDAAFVDINDNEYIICGDCYYELPEKKK